MIEQMGDSLLLSKHSIQLSALFLLLYSLLFPHLLNKLIDLDINSKVVFLLHTTHSDAISGWTGWAWALAQDLAHPGIFGFS